MSDENIEIGNNNVAEDYPLIVYKGAIHYFSTFDDISTASQEILDWVNEENIDKIPIAFDMEWPVSYGTAQDRTALIQLCANLNECFLFHVFELNQLPNALIQLLCHSKVVLHGNRIKGDLRKLQRDFPNVFPDSILDQCIDLGVWCHKVFYTAGSWSMENLVPFMCNLHIDKNANVRTGKWDNFPLTREQQMYAAIDVYISLVIYNKLCARNEENIAILEASIQEIGEFKAKKLEKKMKLAAQKNFRAAKKLKL